MTVYEIGAGGGYYTTILSKIVGPQGKVYAQYSERFWDRAKERAAPLFEKLGNVEATITDTEVIAAPENSLDFIMVALIWHHMHYNPDEGDAFPERSKTFLANALKALKPGGVLGIVEHQAAEGSTRAEAAGWHRTPMQ
ncbi:MAG: methyltransferase domain-containing protein, partial [Alphaproteobacteria bacterium]